MEGKGKVVVGIDGSDSSIQALRLAVRLAPTLDAIVYAVACWEFPMMGIGETAYVPPDFEVIEAAEAQKLADTLANVFGPDLPEFLNQELIHGPAPAKMVQAGAGATMLVVGRRGHGGFRGLHLGSVSSACVSHAECPVLVVHSDDVASKAGSRRTHHLWKGSKTPGQEPTEP